MKMIFKLLFGNTFDFFDKGDISKYSLFIVLMIAFAFWSSFLALKFFRNILPKDQGREFAVNGELSQGKARGCGLIFMTTFTLTAALFIPLTLEYVIYLALIYAAMLTGYLDDASKVPWGRLKKGLLDLAISLGAAIDQWWYSTTVPAEHSMVPVKMPLLHLSFHLPAVVYIALAAMLVWTAINVTNCTDGVDGLCASLVMTVMLGFVITSGVLSQTVCKNFEHLVPVIMLATLAAYLWFNCSPSTMLMGDAGSRALGVMLAVLFLVTGNPFGFIPACIVIILDGGLSLLKISFIRFLKMKNFMKDIRTPLHDHCRKNKGWSDTQVVLRSVIIQLVIDILYLSAINGGNLLGVR